MKEMTREEVIEALIDDDIDIIYSKQATDYLSTILREGFCGYKKQTNAQLKQEYEERLDTNGEGIKIKKLTTEARCWKIFLIDFWSIMSLRLKKGKKWTENQF